MITTFFLKNFRFKADIKPIFIFVSLFALDLGVFFLNLPSLFLAVYSFIMLFPKTMITAWNHHHQHVPTFRNSTLNMFLEVIYGFQTGVLPHGWVLHHNLGHHPNYMKGAKDESAWVTKNGRKMGEVEYTARVGTLAYYEIAKNILKQNRSHGVRFLLGLILTLSCFFLFWQFNAVNAVILFLIPPIFCLYGTVWHTYKHHAGLYTQKAEEACWNMLDPFYNKLTGNLGYHTAHHISCGTHWSKLPELHQKIEPKIPNHLYREPGFPFPLFQTIYRSVSRGQQKPLVDNSTS